MQLTIPMCRELNLNHISAAKSTFYFAEYKEERSFFIGNQSLDMLWHKQKNKLHIKQYCLRQDDKTKLSFDQHN